MRVGKHKRGEKSQDSNRQQKSQIDFRGLFM